MLGEIFEDVTYVEDLRIGIRTKDPSDVFIQSKNKCGGHFIEVIDLHPSIVSLVQRRVSRTVIHGTKDDNLPDINFWDNSSRFPYIFLSYISDVINDVIYKLCAFIKIKKNVFLSSVKSIHFWSVKYSLSDI